MVRKLFNDLVTTLDILPTSSTVDVCINHPSTCVLSGKVRIIAKRPCVYKSLAITVTGSTRVWLRQGAKTFKAKQTFLQTTQQIVHEPSPRRGRSPSTHDILDPTLSASEQQQHQPAPEIANAGSGDELDDSSPITHIHHEHSVRHTTPPPEEDQLAPDALAEAALPPSAAGSPDSQMAPVLNQLVAGVNDIEFTIEFPSHVPSKDDPESASNEMRLSCLPSGPMKTTCGDSAITYTLSAVLVMSRRDILVNNNMSTSIPFRVQNWQDSIDGRQNEDHAYHGKRRGKVEFQFQVPKQLDTRRLHELQFWFQASWRTLSDSLRVKEVQYYLIEEEHQTFATRLAPHIYTTIISTTATHDVSAHATPTNTWDHLRTPIRLQIPQPNTVLESSSMPWPHPLLVSHKLRVLIKFDQIDGRERDLQLSFPILIHPTMDDHGAPVHPLPMDAVPTRRRRRGRQLYGIESGPMDVDGEDDDDILPLPMYADREGTLLLMVGEEIQETDLQGFEMDALGISTAMSYPDQSMPYSPSITSITSSPPISPTQTGSSFLMGPTPVQGEQHTWASASRPMSMMPSGSEHASHFSAASRRFSSIEGAADPFLPPPYRFPSVDEEPTSPTTSVVSSSSVWETHAPSPSSPESASWLHQYQSSGRSLPAAPATFRHRSSASEQGYSASPRSLFTPRITTLASTSRAPNTIDPATGPFATFHGGMPSPPYEYEEDSSRSAGRLGRGSQSTQLSL
ncbi:hypothetical protein BGZ72_003559 [Mortierella alpina]|nr:hypothetical protein BGZ72_003559 [Mortierella alpina]